MNKSRTEILIGKEGLKKLSSVHVAVVGTGGVGGYATIMLARAGIEKFTLIDFDDVAPSNLNRQIVAYKSTIGKKKVEVLKEMLLDINENISVQTFAERLTKDNVERLLLKADIVVDAIDIIQDKVELICYCKFNNKYIISAMGAGNRIYSPNFTLTDIYKTCDDGLAKSLRKKLRERGVEKLDCVISQTKPLKVEGRTIGSISYYPCAMGCFIASVVVNNILEGKIWRL